MSSLEKTQDLLIRGPYLIQYVAVFLQNGSVHLWLGEENLGPGEEVVNLLGNQATACRALLVRHETVRGLSQVGKQSEARLIRVQKGNVGNGSLFRHLEG